MGLTRVPSIKGRRVKLGFALYYCYIGIDGLRHVCEDIGIKAEIQSLN